MNEKQTNKNKDNKSIVEDLDSTMETIANLSKEIQKLAGKLSVLAQQCQDIDKLGIKLQSSTDKSRRLLKQINLYQHPVQYDNTIADILEEHPTLEKTLGGREELNKILSNPKRYQSYGFQYGGPDDVIRRLKMIFYFLALCQKFQGYTYGGFVRDVLVPMTWRNFWSNEIEFKDVDIWFSNTQDYENFLNFVGKLPYLQLTKNEISSYDGVKVKEYPMEHRCQYILSYNGLGKVALVDLVVSKQLPVNDFNVNLLVFKPRGLDYGQIHESWFKVEDNAEGDAYQYSVEKLMEYTVNKSTILLTGYKRFLTKDTTPVMQSITLGRISRMKQWGWNVKE